ncbi:KAT8 regulatory NSL complex subunit 1 [Patella vulgata]|uniref:KAT8 regulatory NSL complex subunit 1 n=1 Tax=Patella vulgata TaxID=6465 RepID=UPI0024A92056|nr:KAT8 regulatory NSL complex subunit 1 [Patella vulgata]
MSTPFSLRICCIAAMAPALTDAASQAKIKLPGAPISPSKTSILNGRDPNDQPTKKGEVCNVFNPVLLGSKTVIKIPSTLHHLTESLKLGVKTSSRVKTKSKSNSKNKTVNPENIPVNEKGLCKQQKPSTFQQEFLKSINIFDRMNQPVPVNGNQHSEKVTESCSLPPVIQNDVKPILVNGKTKLKNKDLHNKEYEDDLKNNVPEFVSMGNRNNLANDGEIVNNSDTVTEKEDTDSGTMVPEMKPLSSLDLDNKQSDITILSSGAVIVNDAEINKIITVAQEMPKTMPQVSKAEKLRAVIEASSEMDLRLEASNTQAQLERRMDFYLRRVRRLQGRELEQHVRNQITLCVEHQQKNLQTVTRAVSSHHSYGLNAKSELNTNVLNKSLSTAALVNLVQQAQKQASQNSTSEISAKRQETTNVLNMDRKTRRECQKVSDQFLMNVHHAETVIDSDATESSSGGESCDEGDPIPVNYRKLHRPLYKRAEWKWCVERAAVASRWTWLQAQVSDLEYRIRQQSDIYKQIRQSKGSIVLGDPPSPPNFMTRPNPGGQKVSLASRDKKTEMSPCNISNLLSNVDKQANRLTLSLGNVLSPAPSPVLGAKSCASSPASSVNGLIESPLVAQGLDSEDKDILMSVEDGTGIQNINKSPVTDTSCQAARCRPLRSYRKRKLLRTRGLHQSSRKAARLSTVDCHCYPPVTPCPMCGGRYNNKQPVDADSMPIRERVSLLDSSFHPVLSFSHDIPLHLHFESLIKTGNWMTKPNKTNVNKNKKRKYKTRIISDQKRKLSKNAAAAILQSAKIRNKYENKAIKRGHNSVWNSKANKKSMKVENKRRKAAKLAVAALKRQAQYFSSDSNLANSISGEGNLSSSCSASLLKEMRAESLRKKRGENAYDINNIVIPYSIAAATRVEKLQYKEIATPEWRDVSQETSLEADQSSSDIEDISDTSFSIRHQKCEAEEKKRFASFIQYPMRRRIRTDLGISTSDPASPDPLGTETFTHTSQEHRPSSPLSAFGDESVGSVHIQRRSSSISKRFSVSSSFDDPLEYEREKVDPWSPRTFPLSEADYEEMKSVEPHVYETLPVISPVQPTVNADVITDSSSRTESTPGSSRPTSPIQSSCSNSVMDDDDPNDPEWTGDKSPGKED